MIVTCVNRCLVYLDEVLRDDSGVLCFIALMLVRVV